MTKKKVTRFIDRFRKRRIPGVPVKPTTETETVEVVAESSPGPRRNLTPLIIVAIFAIAVLTLLAIAFTPGLRETRIARAIRFWQPAPPPEPAVPPGQLATEVQ